MLSEARANHLQHITTVSAARRKTSKEPKPEASPDAHRVYCYFQLNDGWHTCFLEEDLQTRVGPLPWYRTTEKKLRELQERYSDIQSAENTATFEYALTLGRGSLWLNLPAANYQALCKGRTRK